VKSEFSMRPIGPIRELMQARPTRFRPFGPQSLEFAPNRRQCCCIPLGTSRAVQQKGSSRQMASVASCSPNRMAGRLMGSLAPLISLMPRALLWPELVPASSAFVSADGLLPVVVVSHALAVARKLNRDSMNCRAWNHIFSLPFRGSPFLLPNVSVLHSRPCKVECIMRRSRA
jgi:hypothetical protein